MKPYLALIRVNLKLALRERIAIFFNYVFPLIFFFAFGELLHAERGGIIAQVITMVLVIGILGNGLFGGGIRAVQDREQNILRRFKVAPISPGPLLVASMVTGWVLYLPAAVITLVLARVVYGMPLPDRWFSLFILVSAGVIAFRAIGLIIASVANSAQESQVLVQLVYLPMLFLTGTTFSVTILPDWAQMIAQLLPATYLVTALQSTILRHQALTANWTALAVLLVTTAVSFVLAALLFRWEKEEKIRQSAKLALVAMVVPSIAIGAWQIHTRDEVARTKALYRDIQRGVSLLIRGARIVTGDGRVIEYGGVLVRDGKIADVFDGRAPDPGTLRAEPVEAAGKTVLPGLIDLRVQLTASGGFDGPAHDAVSTARHAAAAYLYCGTTAVRSVGDPPETVMPVAAAIETGERLGAEIFASTPGSAPEAYIAGLSAAEAADDLAAGDDSLLGRSLVEQVGPASLIQATRRVLERNRAQHPGKTQSALDDAIERLRTAYRAGVPLAVGTVGGRPLVFHGPAVQRELELWVRAGIPPAVALVAATHNGARVLGPESRIGAIRRGADANLLIVDGNPLEDIAALERVADVIFKGERVDRTALLEQQ